MRLYCKPHSTMWKFSVSLCVCTGFIKNSSLVLMIINRLFQYIRYHSVIKLFIYPLISLYIFICLCRYAIMLVESITTNYKNVMYVIVDPTIDPSNHLSTDSFIYPFIFHLSIHIIYPFIHLHLFIISYT